MSVSSVSAVLTELVLSAAEAAGFDRALVAPEAAVPTQNAAHGDYQSNHAFRVAKALRRNPKEVAAAVHAALLAGPGAGPVFSAVEVAGPGFLNFRLSDDFLALTLAATAADAAGGVAQEGAGKTVVIDYSSPNVAKRMHVGHMRSTLIGNALHRLHAAAGWVVVADNHIGDWGTQYGKLLVAWKRWRDEAAFAADAIGELERLYVLFGDRATPELEDEARAETARLQAGDAENLALWERFVQVSLAEFDRVYARLGVRFDVTLGESFYNPWLGAVVGRALGAGVAVESEGAVVVRFAEDHADRALAGTVLVIRKKDGAALYGTTDLATLDHRRQTWAPEKVLYVTDKRQQLHFKQVFAAWTALEQAAGRAAGPALLHCWFGTLNLPEGAMSTRAGNVIRLVDLLDEAVRRARAIVDEKSAALPEAERAAVAEAVGTAAVRYADLSQNPQSDVVFEWDRMLSFDGNTAPYLLYSHARLCSVERKAAEAGLVAAAAPALDTPESRALALVALRTPAAFAAALDHLRPNLLADHLFELANAANRWYYEVPVLNAAPELRAGRLALAAAARRMLAVGFAGLGLPPLERM